MFEGQTVASGDEILAIMLSDARKIAKDESEAHLLTIKWLSDIQQFCRDLDLSNADIAIIRESILRTFDPRR